MKRINLLVGAMALTAFGFVSCSDDDSDGSDVKFSGTYDLVEVNTQNATDFNDDGTKNVNQLKESNCYNDGKIILNDDGSLKYVITKILVDASDGTSGCATAYEAAGKWEAQSTNGNNTTIEAAFTNQNGASQTITLIKRGDNLTYTDDTILSTYPDRNADGEAINTRGSITYVFEK